MKTTRTCTLCHLPIAKSHRWKTVYHRFLFWTWASFEHRNCAQPRQPGVKRLKGEVPLPFPEHSEATN
jgi:hypothetical protein